MKINFITLYILVLIGTAAVAQNGRTKALGNLSYSIVDSNRSINLMNVSGNPAWLVVDEKYSKLELSSSTETADYGYKRKYSPLGTNSYDQYATMVNPLGISGTFRGTVNYNYELRKSYNQALEMDPYSGKGFFLTDLAAGNFAYRGPSFELMHSLELVKDLYLGASVSYQVLDGKKENYSYALTTFRNVNINFGLAYKIQNNITLGFTSEINNTQENIEVDEINNLSIEIRNYYGEKYFISHLVSTKNEKIRFNKNRFGLQLQWQPDKNIDVVVDGNISSAVSKMLSSGSSTYKDREDNYSSFFAIDISAVSQYRINDELTAGISAGYNTDESWTKISANGLKTWDWETSLTKAGFGLSYSPENSSLLIGLEYELSQVSADSSKYIDSKYASIESLNHLIRTGIEYGLTNSICLRAGYNFGQYEHDLICGGEDLNVNRMFFGLGLNITNDIILDLNADYLTSAPGAELKDLENKIFACAATIRINKL